MNLEEHVDLGSWARFEPTLAAFLDGPARPDGARPVSAIPGGCGEAGPCLLYTSDAADD